MLCSRKNKNCLHIWIRGELGTLLAVQSSRGAIVELSRESRVWKTNMN